MDNNIKNSKDKLLIWIDLEFVFYGISKFIQKHYECDIYAVLDINNKAKKFFDKQKTVKFQKVWNYLDNVTVDYEKFDLEYMKKFEKKYDIDLWNLAYAERTFYKYNQYYNFSSEQILGLLYQECIFFEKVLDEVKPDFMLIKTTDWHQTHLFYELCKARGITVLMLVPTRFGNRLVISENINKLDDFEKHNSSNAKKTSSDLKKFLQKHDGFEAAKGYISIQNQKKDNKMLDALKFILLAQDNDYQKRYSSYKWNKLKILYNEGGNILRKKIRENFINNNFIKNVDYSKPFVYFPLHIEPERSLSIDAPFFTNQIEVITNIVKSLPIGYRLFVKEHPAMKLLAWRETSFYKELMKLPNVFLLHPFIDPQQILENCSLVITITGTAGFEAAFYNKPSIIMADLIYSSIPSTHRLKSFEELPLAIKNSLEKKVNVSDLNEYVQRIENESFEINLDSVRQDFSNTVFYGGYLVDFDIPVSKLETFLEKHKSEFELIALEYIKKIKKYNQKNE